MAISVLKRKSAAFEKVLFFLFVAIITISLDAGCKKAHLGATSADGISAMEFAPANIVTDNCVQQGAYASDCSGFKAEGAGGAKNIILLIGDGMGQNQIFAGRVFINGPQKPLSWEQLPHSGTVTTCAVSTITDSAAAATAIATGNKTQKGALGMQLIPQEKRFTNIVELVSKKKAAGLVTTTKVWDATPAAFAAHVPSRDMDTEIATQMIVTSEVSIILGGGRGAFASKKSSTSGANVIEAAKKKGYKYISTGAELAALDTKSSSKVLGLFAGGSMEFEVARKAGTTEPHLHEMAQTALEILSRDQRGFFLMIEGALIDHACHMMNEKKMSGEMAEFNKTVEMVLEWAKNHPDTLVLVTADHETGTTRIVPDKYKKGDVVKFKWKMTGPMYAYHSGQQVKVFGIGPNSAAIQNHIDNTALFCIMKNAFGVTPAQVGYLQ